MSNLRISAPPAIDWHLARHYHAGSSDVQGSCIGLPRKYAPPPDVDDEPEGARWAERVNQPHATYVGVYLETARPRRYYYSVPIPNREPIRGYGFTSPGQCAAAYDRKCRELGVNLDLLNFEREERAG